MTIAILLSVLLSASLEATPTSEPVPMLRAVPPEEERKWFGLGVRTLRAAVAADSTSGEAVFNLAIAVGRNGLVRGNREKAEASREVKMLAERTLEIDPHNDGAYHLLEIGICSELLGRESETRSIYARVIAMESDHADAPLMREEARRRLAE